MPQGLPRRIRYAFVIQALLAGLSVVALVSVVAWFTRDALVRQHLQAEADAYWHVVPGAGAPAAPTVARHYVAAGDDAAALPSAWHALPEGLTRLQGEPRAVLVTRDPGGRGTLYVSYDTRITDRVLFISAATVIVLGLLAVALITWLTYRTSRQIVLPINRLAEDVARWDPLQGDAVAPLAMTADSSHEVRALSAALQGLAARVAEFVQRERDFTRDASHELRTPLTVIRVASDIMLADPAMPLHSQRSLLRIQRAGRDMEAVIDAFLILAREGGVAPQSEEFDVRDLVLDEVDKVRPLLQGKPVELSVVEAAHPRAFAPPQVMAVIVGHLLRNACTFTEQGRVEVVVEADAVVVRDTGIGMSSEALQRAYDPFFRADAFNPTGKGFGLSIAFRLGRRFGWPLSLDSTQGQGTTAVLRFTPLGTTDGAAA